MAPAGPVPHLRGDHDGDAVGIAGAAILYQTSVQPGAAIVAAVFNEGQLVKPLAGFAQVARTVTERNVALPTRGAPAASLDIYTPDSGKAAPRPVILWIHGGGFISSRRRRWPTTRSCWTGTGGHLNHEYPFNFNLPQAKTAFQRTLAFIGTSTAWGRTVSARLATTTAEAARALGYDYVAASAASVSHHAWSADPWTRRFHLSLRGGAP